MSDPVKPETVERVLERLGFATPPQRTLQGLDALYRAWGRAVPFDNVRKRIALAHGDPGPLPGGCAEDFFEAWLRHGTGGTCWPSSNALFAIVAACGFEAQRIRGSMQDAGWPNHGSVVAQLGGAEYMVDSSMLTDAVVPLRRDEPYAIDDPLHPIRVEPQGREFLIQWSLPVAREPTFPCRLFDGGVDHAFYLGRYEITRAADKSPFNAVLYAGRNGPDSVLGYLGRNRVRKRADAIDQRELEPHELHASLIEELGLSDEIVAEAAELGLLS